MTLNSHQSLDSAVQFSILLMQVYPHKYGFGRIKKIRPKKESKSCSILLIPLPKNPLFGYSFPKILLTLIYKYMRIFELSICSSSTSKLNEFFRPNLLKYSLFHQSW